MALKNEVYPSKVGTPVQPDNDGAVLVEVHADFSSFYLRGARLHYDPALVGKIPWPGLIDGDDEEIMFTSFRQHGPFPVDVEVRKKEPAVPDSSWTDVLEFSFTAQEGFALGGWDSNDPSTPIPANVGEEFRGRYAVANADEAHSVFERPYPEVYQLLFWPAPLEPVKLVRSDSAAGEYWNFQFEADAARSLALEYAAGTRTRAIIEMAFRDHPESAKRIARGELQFMTGIMAYSQKIYPHELEDAEIRSLIQAIATDVHNEQLG
jgi:hypothetical protein